jgi:hypothetical protein
MNSGNSASFSSFTYGDFLYITGNSPTEGGLGDLVIIYGSGFEDPLQVFLGGELMEVVSVSGTELVVRIPDDLGTECQGSTDAFKVVLLESGLETDGGNFTIIGNSPTVLSVSPIILQEDAVGDLDPDDITITGQDFADEVLVEVGTYVIPSSQVTVNSATSIDVDNLPNAGTLGITFVTTPCTLALGRPGEQSSATPLAVSVTNFPGACKDTLQGAIVVEPFDSACTALPPVMAVEPLGINYGTTAGTRNFTITNTGGSPFDWLATETLDPDGVFAITSANSGTLDFGDSAIVTVSFTLAGGAAVHSGAIDITTIPIGIDGSPETVTLTAETP